MLRNSFRKWFLANRLYHYLAKVYPKLWEEEIDFVEYLVESRWIRWYPMRWLFHAKNDSHLENELMNILSESERLPTKYIQSRQVDLARWISLSEWGNDNYSLSALIFGDVSNFRKIVFALITLPGVIFYWHALVHIIQVIGGKM